jgi:hypothetical protein
VLNGNHVALVGFIAAAGVVQRRRQRALIRYDPCEGLKSSQGCKVDRDANFTGR